MSCQLATSSENLVASAQFLVALATSESQFRALDTFFAQYSKSTSKVPAVDLLRLNTLRGTKTAFVTATRKALPVGKFEKNLQKVPGSCFVGVA